jgi:hypothetical protein
VLFGITFVVVDVVMSGREARGYRNGWLLINLGAREKRERGQRREGKKSRKRITKGMSLQVLHIGRLALGQTGVDRMILFDESPSCSSCCCNFSKRQMQQTSPQKSKRKKEKKWPRRKDSGFPTFLHRRHECRRLLSSLRLISVPFFLLLPSQNITFPTTHTYIYILFIYIYGLYICTYTQKK